MKVKRKITKKAHWFTHCEAKLVIDNIKAKLNEVKRNEHLIGGQLASYVDQVVKKAMVEETLALEYDWVQTELILGRSRKTIRDWLRIIIMEIKHNVKNTKQHYSFTLAEAGKVIDGIIAELEIAKGDEERLLNGYMAIHIERVVSKALIESILSLDYDKSQACLILGRSRQTQDNWQNFKLRKDS